MLMRVKTISMTAKLAKLGGRQSTEYVGACARVCARNSKDISRTNWPQGLTLS